MNDMYRHLPDRPARNRATGWRDQAACRDIDPELFFPVGNAGAALLQISQAKQVCAACPARSPCLHWALDSGQEAGVWGGTSEDERRAVRYRRMRPAGTGPDRGPLLLRPMSRPARGHDKDTPAHLARRTDGRGIDPGRAMATQSRRYRSP
jgi:WhiB family redox-sensing transcriptional regulator